MTYEELLSELYWELRSVALDGRFVPTNNSAQMLLMKAYEIGFAEGEVSVDTDEHFDRGFEECKEQAIVALENL